MRNILEKSGFKDIFYIIIIYILSVYYSSNNYIQKPTFKPVVKKEDTKGTKYTEIKKEVFDKSYVDKLTDSFRKVLKKRVKDVIVVETPIYIDTHSNNLQIDTVNKLVRDSISTKEYFISYTGNYSTKQSNFKVNLTTDTATYLTTYKRKLKTTEMYVSIYHTNSLFTSTSGYSYTVENKKPRVVLGPSIGIMYDGAIKPYIGIGLTYNLLSLK